LCSIYVLCQTTSLLEYSSVVLSPQYISDMRALEKVQRRFTKRFIPTLQQLPYSRRIEQLDLQSLELRRLINDLVMCDKKVFGLTCLKMSDYFILVLSLSHVDILIKLFVLRTQLSTPGNTTSVYVLSSHGIT